MSKINKISLIVLLCFVCIFAGYFWRMYHEVKNWDKWQQHIVKEFLYEIEKEERQVFRVHDWIFIKKSDGSVVLRKKQ